MKIFTVMLKNVYLKNVVTLMTGAIGAQVIAFLLTPVITRLYSPENFGIMTIFGTILSIFTVIACGRYEQAIVLPKDNSEAWIVLVLSLIICASLTLISVVILVSFYHTISQLIFKTDKAVWLWFIPLAVLLSGVRLILNYWTVRKQNFKILSISSLFETLGNSGIKVTSGLAIGNTVGGLIGGILGRSLFPDVLLGINIYKRDFPTIMRIPNKHELSRVLKKYRNFPLFSTWSGLLNELARGLPVFFLAYLFDNKIVGAFGLAHNTLRVPIGIIGNSVRQVYLQRVASLISEKKKFQSAC